MDNVFTPYEGLSVNIPASEPHPAGTEYKVSIGNEKWGEEDVPVVKVQMIYDSKISGRKSPSFPSETNDYELVCKAGLRLQKIWMRRTPR